MSKRYPPSSHHQTQLDQTFRFDSRSSFRPSKPSHSQHQEPPLLQSQSTSQFLKFIEDHNQHILEILSESEQQKRTQKQQKQQRNQLWDFFARFEKQSNPDITISEIEVPLTRNLYHNQNKILGRSFNSAAIREELQNTEERKIGVGSNAGVGPSSSNRQIFAESNREINDIQIGQNNQIYDGNVRYPRRNRIHPLRFWLGEKCVYKYGKIVKIIKKDLDNL